MADKSTPKLASASLAPPLTPQGLLALGTPHLAYIRRIVVEGEIAYAIHGADGATLGVVSDREVAFATARQHDLEPVSVH